MGLTQWWLNFFFCFLGVGLKNYLLLYRLPKNNKSTNIYRFKLRFVRRRFGILIEAIPHSPREVNHQLVRICMNGTASHLCANCELFSNKNRTWYKCKYSEYNMPLCSVGDRSSPVTGQDCFALVYYTPEMLREVLQKYLTLSAKNKKNKCI